MKMLNTILVYSYIGVVILIFRIVATEIKYQWSPSDSRWDCVVGISYDESPVSTGVFIHTHTILTSANPLEEHLDGATDVATHLGAHVINGNFNVSKKLHIDCVKSPWDDIGANNKHHNQSRMGTKFWIEMKNGEKEEKHHSPLHDLLTLRVKNGESPFAELNKSDTPRVPFVAKTKFRHEITLENILMFGGFGYLSRNQVNGTKLEYDVFDTKLPTIRVIKDCDRYLYKTWGNFICLDNLYNVPGVPSGGPLFYGGILVGIASFSFLFSNESINVFTDLRAYFVKEQILGKKLEGFVYCCSNTSDPKQDTCNFAQDYESQGFHHVKPLTIP